ncbi:hypothetical protein [Nocardiopsis ansamitocini]|uniref:Uncharacterized protein n=1 Tax=Nocardiopsis ansamitocini TaxID=1670832 RepID=A0A9W6UK16_9ACTN|nr:hypothetical protein [Nocardiopsis ansamitocini]GLU49083.1 hypothetical protein Nans01_34340 [Nocardiopsis ansamitocini]
MRTFEVWFVFLLMLGAGLYLVLSSLPSTPKEVATCDGEFMTSEDVCEYVSSRDGLVGRYDLDAMREKQDRDAQFQPVVLVAGLAIVSMGVLFCVGMVYAERKQDAEAWDED